MGYLTDQSGGMFAAATAAGAAQGKAAGSTYGIGDALGHVAGVAQSALMMKYQQQQKIKDSSAAVDEWTKGGLLSDPEEKALFNGMAIAGMDKDHMAVLLNHHLDEKQKNLIEKSKQDLEQKKAMGYTREGEMPAGQEGPGAPEKVPGSIETNASRAQTAAGGLAVRRDQGQQRLDQGLVKIDQTEGKIAGNEALGTRRADIAQQNADANTARAGKAGAGKSELPAETEFTQADTDYKAAVRHTNQARSTLSELKKQESFQKGSVPVNRMQSAERSVAQAQTAEQEALTKKQAAIGKRGDERRSRGGAPKAGGSDPVQSTIEKFRTQHGRDPNPDDPNDVAEMRSLHGATP